MSPDSPPPLLPGMENPENALSEIEEATIIDKMYNRGYEIKFIEYPVHYRLLVQCYWCRSCRILNTKYVLESYDIPLCTACNPEPDQELADVTRSLADTAQPSTVAKQGSCQIDDINFQEFATADEMQSHEEEICEQSDVAPELSAPSPPPALTPTPISAPSVLVSLKPPSKKICKPLTHSFYVEDNKLLCKYSKRSGFKSHEDRYNHRSTALARLNDIIATNKAEILAVPSRLSANITIKCRLGHIFKRRVTGIICGEWCSGCSLRQFATQTDTRSQPARSPVLV